MHKSGRVFMTPFGIYLENLRRSRRMQQKQLADLMGINRSEERRVGKEC